MYLRLDLLARRGTGCPNVGRAPPVRGRAVVAVGRGQRELGGEGRAAALVVHVQRAHLHGRRGLGGVVMMRHRGDHRSQTV